MSTDELPFLCHGDKDYAKILWKDGEAVGFYSVKTAGNYGIVNYAFTRDVSLLCSIQVGLHDDFSNYFLYCFLWLAKDFFYLNT